MNIVIYLTRCKHSKIEAYMYVFQSLFINFTQTEVYTKIKLYLFNIQILYKVHPGYSLGYSGVYPKYTKERVNRFYYTRCVFKL